MIDSLATSRPLRSLARLAESLRIRAAGAAAGLANPRVLLRVALGGLALGLGLLFLSTLDDYLASPGEAAGLEDLPSAVPLLFQGVGVFLALVAFVASWWIGGGGARSRGSAALLVSVLWVAALAALAAWLPADILETREALAGKALAGEPPAVGAYAGQIALVTLLILSVPVLAMVYFRLDLMDRYVLLSFLGPLGFCLISFFAIWVIADLMDNGAILAPLGVFGVVNFYVVHVPFVLLFVMPIAVLLSGLSALSRMSKSNELISMIGSGRSVVRILLPLFAAAGYTSVVATAFKYEWSPSAVGFRDAVRETLRRESRARRDGEPVRQDVWSQRGWMHVDEVERRTWFVGKVPFKLSDEMGDVVVWQLDERDQTVHMWKAERVRWVWNAAPPAWILVGVKHYEYGEDRVPAIHSSDLLVVKEWSETPWKVLSSAQNPEYLGITGLSRYLKANADMDSRSLAPFRTNWWYIFAEPWACFALMLVAAPLGIVYSRKGAMAGVAGALVAFALMYVMRGTLLAMGHGDRIHPFVAAWGTNAAVAAVGLWLLWFRARNRDIPTLRSLFRSPARRPGGGRAAPAPAPPGRAGGVPA